MKEEKERRKNKKLKNKRKTFKEKISCFSLSFLLYRSSIASITASFSSSKPNPSGVETLTALGKA